MIKVSILKDNVQTHGATFQTLEEANTWLSQGAEGKWWGEPAYTEIIPAILDEEGNELEPEQTIKHEAEYSVVIEDISSEIAYEKEIAKNLARMDFGKRLMAELAASNQADLLQGVLTVQQIIEAEESLSNVQRLLLNGSLGLATALLNQITVPHLPQEKKDAFLSKMQGYLSNEP